jgi:predicted AAA+ superfamily ATPase
MKAHTALEYLDALTRIFVLEDLPAWAPALRSRSRLREAPKRHFVDPSIAVAALGADPDRLLREVDTFGVLFESMVVRDLRVYAQATDAEVLHYHDNTGLEADAIVQRRDGAWGAFEVKLGATNLESAATTLLRLAAKVDPTRHGAPSVLGVITSRGYGYRRPDGVSVIPIGSLGP